MNQFLLFFALKIVYALKLLSLLQIKMLWVLIVLNHQDSSNYCLVNIWFNIIAVILSAQQFCSEVCSVPHATVDLEAIVLRGATAGTRSLVCGPALGDSPAGGGIGSAGPRRTHDWTSWHWQDGFTLAVGWLQLLWPTERTHLQARLERVFFSTRWFS